jgi:hypothetical protein
MGKEIVGVEVATGYTRRLGGLDRRKPSSTEEQKLKARGEESRTLKRKRKNWDLLIELFEAAFNTSQLDYLLVLLWL